MSNFTNEEKINALFKYSQHTISTRNDLPFYQEPKEPTSRLKILNSQYWLESEAIPTAVHTNLINATTDDSSSAIAGSTTGKTEGVVKKYVKIELEEVSGSNGAAYQGPLVNGVRLLENIIPFNFNSATDNTSYAYTLYKNDGTTEIPFGTGEWVIDHNSGVITFYDLSGISGVSSNTQELVSILTACCLLYRNGMINWNKPKVINAKIAWTIPITISPLKIGTKKPKRKYVHE